MNRQQYLMGMKAASPVILGFIPVGIAYAIMAQQAGFSIGEIILMSVMVFAGASQMMASGMFMQGAGLFAIILATFILNLRHLIMSTCVFNKMIENSMLKRLLASFGVTDESFAIFTTADENTNSSSYFLGMITVTYSSWVVGSAIGAFATEILPEILSKSLGISLYAMFIALLMPSVRGNTRLALLVCLTGLVNLALTFIIAPSWALILATLLCAWIGIYFIKDEL